MRRLLLSATLLLALTSPASAARWGETPPVALAPDAVATCVRDAGGGRIAALGGEKGSRGAALYVLTPDGLRPDGDVRFGRALDRCPAVAAAGSGAAVAAAVIRRPSRTRFSPPRLLVAIRDPGGGFGNPVVLARPAGPQTQVLASVAVGADGRAAAAWVQTAGSPVSDAMPQRITIVQRAPGGAFGPPQTLVSRGHSWGTQVAPALAFDAAGTLTVAWMRSRAPGRGGSDLHDVEVATAPPGGTVGAPQRLARVQYPTALSLAVAPDGRALLAFDGNDVVRVHERPPGAAAFGAEPAFASDGGARSPSVALAADGGAVVGWRLPGGGATLPDIGSAAQSEREGVAAVARPPGGPFGAPQRLAAPAGHDATGIGLYASDDGVPVDVESERLRVAAAPGGQAAIGWTTVPVRVGVLVTGHLAVASGGRFGPATALGGPVRDVDAAIPVLSGGGAVAVWADNGSDFGEVPTGRGRFHVSSPAIAPADPPAPAVALSARPQALYHTDPLFVTARCAAACDLRATIRGRPGRRPGTRRGAAQGSGGRATAGPVRLRLASFFAGPIAPRGGGTVRVVVRATAPGGHAVARRVLRVPVRRRVPPPFQRPFAVRARRVGDDVIVTWRTAGPARRMVFVAFGRRTRRERLPAGQFPPYAFRSGRGDRRFRVRIPDAPAVRWVVLHASAMDPPARGARFVVRVR